MQTQTRPVGRRLSTAIWMLLALSGLAFGWMAIDHAATLHAGEPAAWARLQAVLVSEDFSFGARSTHQLQETEGRPYRQSMTAMRSHMALGGVLLISGLLQFVPPLRRRWPRLHRATGALFAATCLVSMGSALAYLYRTPFELVYSGRPFAIGLTAQALTVLSGLLLAIAAIRARDYASHMGWMALIFGVILSAPVLRMEWALVGALLPLTQEQVNLGVTATLNSFCMLPMAIWLATVGAREFRPRASGLHMPQALLMGLATLAGLSVIHEGVLLPFGLDLFGALRPDGLRLPAAALLWSGAALLSLLLMPGAWRAAERGERIAPLPAGVALIVAAGAGLLALTPPPPDASLIESVQPIVWGGYALILLVLLALARAMPLHAGRHDPWSVQLQAMLLTPALWGPTGLLLHAFGFTFAEAYAGAVGLALGSGAVVGFALAYNLSVHLPRLARPPVQLPGT